MTVSKSHAGINLLKDELRQRGYTYASFDLGGREFTRFTSAQGRSWLTQSAHMSYPMVTAASQAVSKNKALSYELCQANNIRTPKTITVEVLADAATEIGALMASGPVIVKPIDASLGWGLTLDIRSKLEVEAAVHEAQQFSRRVLVQQQVTGEEVRFIVIDGQVKAALLRQTPRVIGDGMQTVAALIEQENNNRVALKGLQVPYPLLDDSIVDFSKIDTQAVLPAGEILELNKSTMIRGGASIYNVIESLDDGYKQVASRAAKALAAPFVVVDIMIEDLLQPATDNNYAFIEFNSSPVLVLCYCCRDGKQYDVITDIANLIDQAMAGKQHG